MKYVYPVIITPSEEGGYSVEVPDLPGVFTCGDSLAEAIEMAEDAIAMWLANSEDKCYPIPSPSESLHCGPCQIVSLVKADTKIWRRFNDNREIRKNLTIPAWLNNLAEDAQINFSNVLQDALKAHLKIRT